MAIVDPHASQQVTPHRDTTVSNERLNEERADHGKQVKDRDTVGPRRSPLVLNGHVPEV